MTDSDGFHPDLTSGESARRSLRCASPCRASELSAGTAQTEGMQRFAAISGTSVRSENIWMGETHVSPATASDNHHHGKSETAIFVRSGNPEFVFHDGVGEVRIATAAGDTSSSLRTFRTEKKPGSRRSRCDRDRTQHPRGNCGQSSGAVRTLESVRLTPSGAARLAEVLAIDRHRAKNRLLESAQRHRWRVVGRRL